MSKYRLNYLLYCKNVVKIVNEYYEEGWTTYAAVWRRYVNPVYPMSYQKFISIINMPNLDRQIAEEKAKAKNNRLPAPDTKKERLYQQLSLFENKSE